MGKLIEKMKKKKVVRKKTREAKKQVRAAKKKKKGKKKTIGRIFLVLRFIAKPFVKRFLIPKLENGIKKKLGKEKTGIVMSKIEEVMKKK